MAQLTRRQEIELESLPSLQGDLTEAMHVSNVKRSDVRVSYFDWSIRIPAPKTGTLNFSQFPFQREWYEDDEVVFARFLAMMKATQIGASEWLIRWAIYFPDTRGETTLYVFPKSKQLKDFSDMRVRPMVKKSDYLRRRVTADSVDNKLLKQIGLGFLNCRGSQNEDEVNSVDADNLAFDEYDSLVLRNVSAAERRVSAPTSSGRIRRVGVPTVPGRGIHKVYRDETDQREWLVKCTCKAGWQPIHFYPQGEDEFAYVDTKRMTLVCWKCGKPITPRQVAEGRWVPRKPEREQRGYHISKLIVPGADLRPIVANSKKTVPYEITDFWTKDLGLPYANPEEKLTAAVIQAAQRDYRMPQRYSGPNPVTAGLDVATVRNLNLRISEHLDVYTKRALWIGEVESFDDVPLFMARYNVNMLVVDHLPEGRLARALANRFPGRVYLCSYSDRPVGEVLRVNDDQWTANVDRTRAIDGMIAMMRAQKNLLPVDLPEGYTDQLQSPTRFHVFDEKTQKEKIGYESVGPDHYAHAEVYDLVALELLHKRQMEDALSKTPTVTYDDIDPDYRRSDLADDGMNYRAGPEETLGWGPDGDDEDDGAYGSLGSDWQGE